MNYSYDQLEKDIAARGERLKAIRQDRGRRYGGRKDTLANVRACDPENAWRGAYVSAMECMHRLRNMFMTPIDQMDWKDFENATDDLINYANYIPILAEQAVKSSEDVC